MRYPPHVWVRDLLAPSHRANSGHDNVRESIMAANTMNISLWDFARMVERRFIACRCTLLRHVAMTS